MCSSRVAGPSARTIWQKRSAIMLLRLLMRRAGRRFVIAAAILLYAAATLTGAEWSEIGSGLPRTTPAVKSLSIDPATPSTVYAIDNNGRLFKSIDTGGS